MGKCLYGYDPTGEPNPSLKPLLRLSTKIVQIKKLKRGDYVGYDATYKSTKNIQIAILPLGYNDGLDRRLSNKGVVQIDGVECPIIGRISMNVTAIDISNVKNPFVSQEVIVFSEKAADKNSVLNASKDSETIAYDLFVRLIPSTRREVV